MEEKTKEVIGTIKLGQRGIVYESRDSFHNSVFHKVYERATMLINDSLREQLQEGKEETHGQVDNIIAFVGRRGTGKTSAMLSFMEGLKHNSDCVSEYGVCIRQGRPLNFINLEWIDASLLENNEDIFDSILAKMLGEFLKMDERSHHYENRVDYEVRDLHQRFGQIYKKVLNLKKRNERLDFSGETAISSLRALARSNELRDDFEELVRLYIRVMSKLDSSDRFNNEETFLVIAIDDLDMNVDCGFEILEDIQRYLKIKGLIVLLAINYEQMLICCEKHFSRIYSDYSYASSEKRNYVTRIAEEYMEKALPSYMRTYLPSLKKRDYDRSKVQNMKIVGTEESLSIKQSMFRLVNQKTMVRYDSEGRKRHFMEPSTLRNLNNQYLFYSAMEDIELKNAVAQSVEEQKKLSKDRMARFEWNYRRSMNDLLFRFSFENLQNKERKFFIELSEEDIRRRGEIIVSRLIREINRVQLGKLQFTRKNTRQEFVHEFQEECKVYGYSYGELLRSFYYYSREDFFDRKLVHALLAMYTLAMTRIFYRYREEETTVLNTRGMNPQNAGEQKNYEMLKELLAESAAGSWALYLLPRLKDSVIKNGKYTGAIKKGNLNNKTLDFTVSVMHNSKRKRKSSVLDHNFIKGLVEELTPLFLLSLFLTEIKSESGEALEYEDLFELSFSMTELKLTVDSDTKNRIIDKQVRVHFSNVTACFNIMNFINNIFCFEDRMHGFIRGIVRKCDLGDQSDNKSEQSANMIDQSVEAVKALLCSDEGTFYHKMHGWVSQYGGAVVPFYSTDFYYNMLKRMVRERRMHPDPVIEEKQLFDYFQRLLKDIEKALKKSDEYYFGEKSAVLKENCNGAECSKGNKDSFFDCFKKCPAISMFIETENNQVKDLFNFMVSSMANQTDNGNIELDKLDDYSVIFD